MGKIYLGCLALTDILHSNHDYMLYLQPTENKSEVSRLRRERDEMQSMLEKFEKHLTSVSCDVLFSCCVY